MMWFFEKSIVMSFVIWTLSTKCFATGLSNLEFLASLADSLIETTASEIYKDLQNRIIIKSLDGNAENDWFIENQLIEVLQNKGSDSIYLNHDSENINFSKTNENSFSLFEFKVLNLSIEYSKSNDQGVTNPGYVLRKGNISFFLRVIQHPSGEILLNRKIEESKHDWIPKNEINTLENPNVAFTAGVLKTNTGKIKILEPLLISGVSGIIVYLFYSLRSR